MNLKQRLLKLESHLKPGKVSKEDQEFFDYMAHEQNPTREQIMNLVVRQKRYYLLEDFIGMSWKPEKQEVSGES